MEWKPITESALWDLILAAEARMEPPETKLWEFIRVRPQKVERAFLWSPWGRVLGWLDSSEIQ